MSYGTHLELHLAAFLVLVPPFELLFPLAELADFGGCGRIIVTHHSFVLVFSFAEALELDFVLLVGDHLQRFKQKNDKFFLKT